MIVDTGERCDNSQILPVTVAVNQCGRNVLKLTDVSPCINARDYKGYAGKKDMIAVIEEQKGVNDEKNSR